MIVCLWGFQGRYLSSQCQHLLPQALQLCPETLVERVNLAGGQPKREGAGQPQAQAHWCIVPNLREKGGEVGVQQAPPLACVLRKPCAKARGGPHPPTPSDWTRPRSAPARWGWKPQRARELGRPSSSLTPSCPKPPERRKIISEGETRGRGKKAKAGKEKETKEN